MSIDPRIQALQEEVAGWRQDFHAHPELGYEVHRTAGIVAAKLREFGCDEVTEGIGKTGVVGIIHGRNGPGGRVVGLRADMDALPIEEETNLPHRSTNSGKMHACGHDGHTAMLLGAAKHLAETRDFAGTAIPTGHIAVRPGPIMAAADQFVIQIEGRGAHAAAPHLGVDPVVVGAHIVAALQSIASRNADPLKAVVVSTTMFHAGTAFNIIPQRAELTGTVRTLELGMRDLAEKRLTEIATGTAKMFGAVATVKYERGYPATINHPRETAEAVTIAKRLFGSAAVDAEVAPMMGGEDFSYMLEARPGAYLFIGNGDTAGLHHPAYDFNDSALPHGIQFWAEIARARTAA